jgi:hypothetical protein
MQSVVEHLLGIIRPIDPRQWPLVIRRLRMADGWMPPMMLIATVVSLWLVGRGVGLLGDNVSLKIFNYVALATWLVVGVFSSCAVTIDGLHNLRRLGPLAASRPGWWIELARLNWVFLLFVGLSAPVIHFAGGAQLRPIADILFRSIGPFFVTFMVFSTGGYLVSVVTRRRRRGRAFECVQYFYWIFGVSAAVTASAIWIPARAGWAEPMTALACVIAASLMGALGLSIADRWRQRARRPGKFTS